jgi:hypothetical protein
MFNEPYSSESSAVKAFIALKNKTWRSVVLDVQNKYSRCVIAENFK